MTSPGTTTARGYGHAHQQERKRRLPHYQPADPCGCCGRPLGEDRRRWHLPHNEDRTGYLPGFWCARCNTTEGAVRRWHRRPRRVSALRW